jgi:hypothetical protein
MRVPFLLVLIVLLAACRERAIQDIEDIPTLATLEDLATVLPLTQNAPPAPFNADVTDFSRIDNNLTRLAGWRYVVTLEFDGVFARTPREIGGSARAEVWFNQLASARRITFATNGDLFGENGQLAYEAVRLGRDAFLIRDAACAQDLNGESGDAQTAADLGAGALIGGVARAYPAGRRATINGQDVYAYTFADADLSLPSITLGDGGVRRVVSYDFWIAPSAAAVIRFYVNLDVENVTLLDSQLPVSGQVIIRYDLHDVGSAYNITIPNGC